MKSIKSPLPDIPGLCFQLRDENFVRTTKPKKGGSKMDFNKADELEKKALEGLTDDYMPKTLKKGSFAERKTSGIKQPSKNQDEP